MADPSAFETEMIGGVPHYKPGQRAAFRDSEDPDAALLMFTSQMGHCVIVACYLVRGANDFKGEWTPMAVVRAQAGGVSSDWEKPPPCFELSPESIEALDNATVIEDDDG